MKRTILAGAISMLMASAALAEGPRSAVKPQELTAGSHMQLSAMFSGESLDIDVPGMPNARKWIYDMLETALPEVSAAWEIRGFDAQSHLKEMTCITSPDSFLVEDQGETWLYHDDRVYSCSLGQEPFMLNIRVTWADDGAKTRWNNTEVIEIIGIRPQ